MALKGQKRRFAEAIVLAKPLKISNREAALKIGCKENSASASGSRCAADKEVQAYILAHWPDYYEVAAAVAPQAATQQSELPLFCARDIAAWLTEEADAESLQQIADALATRGQGAAELNAESVKGWVAGQVADAAAFREVVQAVCSKLGASVEPMDWWDSVLINPYATPKEKSQAAADKAKYTLAKPAAQNKKDAALVHVQQLRSRRLQDATGSLFGDDDSDGLTRGEYKGVVPLWN